MSHNDSNNVHQPDEIHFQMNIKERLLFNVTCNNYALKFLNYFKKIFKFFFFKRLQIRTKYAYIGKELIGLRNIL